MRVCVCVCVGQLAVHKPAHVARTLAYTCSATWQHILKCIKTDCPGAADDFAFANICRFFSPISLSLFWLPQLLRHLNFGLAGQNELLRIHTHTDTRSSRAAEHLADICIYFYIASRPVPTQLRSALHIYCASCIRHEHSHPCNNETNAFCRSEKTCVLYACVVRIVYCIAHAAAVAHGRHRHSSSCIT